MSGRGPPRRGSKYTGPPSYAIHLRTAVARGGGATTISAKIIRPRCTQRRRTYGRSRRGVSDVVGTILLLALTVTLFASIFFFVNTFPRPPAQPADQFQANLLYGGVSGKSILTVQVTHLAGPTLAGTGVLIYLYSSAQPSRFTTPYHLSDGLNGSQVWTLGQTWTLNVTAKGLTTPDNITVSIATNTELLFRVTLPGSNPNIPPEFVNVGTSPAGPAIGQGFTVFVQIVDDDLNIHSVYVNLSQLPGVSGALALPTAMSYSATTGLWSFLVPAGITITSGTFYVFVNATDKIFQVNSVAIPVVIGAGVVTQANVVLAANPTAPVRGSAVTLTAIVTNPGSNGGAVNVTFRVAGVTVGTATGSVGAGASASFSTSWTPANAGTVSIAALANVSGGGAVSGTLNLTVFPKILLVPHSVIAGTAPAITNESAYLAEHLAMAGIPFTQLVTACNAALPATMASYDIVIVDFGSTNVGVCHASPSAAVQNQITAAAPTTSFWILGSDAWATTACNSYQSAYMSLFGVGWLAGATCTTLQVAATTSATWVGAPASGLRSDGIGAMSINKTFAGSAAFDPYYTFAKGTQNGGTAFLTTVAGTTGIFRTAGAHRYVAMGVTGARLADPLPNGNTWVSGTTGTEVAYNVMNYLSAFSSASSTGRALPDFGVGGAAVVGTSHAATTTVYATIRANGPSGGVVTVTLYVNGSVAFYQGVAVSQSVLVGGAGADLYATLTWLAPGAASYTLSVVITTNQLDLYSPNDQIPLVITNQPFKIV